MKCFHKSRKCSLYLVCCLCCPHPVSWELLENIDNEKHILSTAGTKDRVKKTVTAAVIVYVVM